MFFLCRSVYAHIALQILKLSALSYFRQASKDKISAALRKIWERRILSVRSRQKVMQIWSDSIAEAAKRGDYSQDKLDWDSYERIKSEMISMFLWNKERGHTIKKLKKAVAKIAAKKLQAAGRRKVQAAGTKKLNPEKIVLQKPDAQLTQVVVSARPKLKERLTKVMTIPPVSSFARYLCHATMTLGSLVSQFSLF